MAKQWPPKDPDEVLDYRINWAGRLTSESVASSSWEITGPDALLVQNSATIEDVETVIWLSGGTLGKTYSLTNHIVTSAGREMDQTVTLKIRQK